MQAASFPGLERPTPAPFADMSCPPMMRAMRSTKRTRCGDSSRYIDWSIFMGPCTPDRTSSSPSATPALLYKSICYTLSHVCARDQDPLESKEAAVLLLLPTLPKQSSNKHSLNYVYYFFLSSCPSYSALVGVNHKLSVLQTGVCSSCIKQGKAASWNCLYCKEIDN